MEQLEKLKYSIKRKRIRWKWLYDRPIEESFFATGSAAISPFNLADSFSSFRWIFNVRIEQKRSEKSENVSESIEKKFFFFFHFSKSTTLSKIDTFPSQRASETCSAISPRHSTELWTLDSNDRNSRKSDISLIFKVSCAKWCKKNSHGQF